MQSGTLVVISSWMHLLLPYCFMCQVLCHVTPEDGQLCAHMCCSLWLHMFGDDVIVPLMLPPTGMAGAHIGHRADSLPVIQPAPTRLARPGKQQPQPQAAPGGVLRHMVPCMQGCSSWHG